MPVGTPALCPRMSTGPNGVCVALMICCRTAASVMSPGAAQAFEPCCFRPRVAVTARSVTQSFTATRAPCAASALATPSPMPCPAAISKATLPSKRNTLHGSQGSNAIEQAPRPSICIVNRSPACAGINADSEPDRMISPARNGMPKLPSVLANQATACAGWP